MTRKIFTSLILSATILLSSCNNDLLTAKLLDKIEKLEATIQSGQTGTKTNSQSDASGPSQTKPVSAYAVDAQNFVINSQRLSSGAIGDVSAGSVKINGVTVDSPMVFAPQNNAEQNAKEVARVLNSLSDKTGVRVETDGQGLIKLIGLTNDIHDNAGKQRLAPSKIEIYGAPQQIGIPNGVHDNAGKQRLITLALNPKQLFLTADKRPFTIKPGAEIKIVRQDERNIVQDLRSTQLDSDFRVQFNPLNPTENPDKAVARVFAVVDRFEQPIENPDTIVSTGFTPKEGEPVMITFTPAGNLAEPGTINGGTVTNRIVIQTSVIENIDSRNINNSGNNSGNQVTGDNNNTINGPFGTINNCRNTGSFTCLNAYNIPLSIIREILGGKVPIQPPEKQEPQKIDGNKATFVPLNDFEGTFAIVVNTRQPERGSDSKFTLKVVWGPNNSPTTTYQYNGPKGKVIFGLVKESETSSYPFTVELDHPVKQGDIYLDYQYHRALAAADEAYMW